ncbi:hypothetical protein BDY17DRAFT_310554 [Neohortaea acidophila]|uniref:BTB domain-containing protein n=1 Tax=Neohortaea acidophila TaxID=245834 RepID=A0A6A6PTY7_9PEZI|nr:uncharacterized protein BDY17DRAFT_310554 [Neohortaea acidophila]KAF2483579.1 hypothetical protein BDY17DRAFT_310554 [Neohortaea acidophila]
MSSAPSSPSALPECAPAPLGPSNLPHAESTRPSGAGILMRPEPVTIGEPFSFAWPDAKRKADTPMQKASDAKRKMDPVTQHTPDAKRKMDPVTLEPPDAKRTRLEYKDTVTVIAGESFREQLFVVHTEIATAHSDFFRKACGGAFREAKEATVRLPEIKADTFRSYVHWLYTGNALVTNKTIDGVQRPYFDSYAIKERIQLLTELYIAADMLADLPLRNAVIDALVEHLSIGDCVLAGTIEMTYTHTPETSKIRKLFVDHCRTLRSVNFFKVVGERLPHGFLLDLVMEMTGTNPAVAKLTYADRCRYHEHSEHM